MRTRLLTLLLAASAALPAAASASTITQEGGTLVVRAAPGETNVFHIGPDDDSPGGLLLSDTNRPTSYPSDCTVPWDYFAFVSCPTPSGGVRIEGGDRDDQLNVDDNVPSGLAMALDGGTGNDVLRGPAFTETTDTLIGGDGNDKITGGIGADAIDGGSGDDELDAQECPDVIHAGAGNDKLLADDWDEQSTDVIDGGPGFDQISNNWVSESGNFQPPIVVSIDRAANDGRPGENDNVTDVESIYLNEAATLTGSDGPDEFMVFNNDAPSTFNGRGGDDKLTGFDLADTIDGGAGNDTIEGGYGHDTITGGPGHDVINGDSSASTCNWIQCRNPYGNDKIDARDGEADEVTCGVGEDVVEADPGRHRRGRLRDRAPIERRWRWRRQQRAAHPQRGVALQGEGRPPWRHGRRHRPRQRGDEGEGPRATRPAHGRPWPGAGPLRPLHRQGQGATPRQRGRHGRHGQAHAEAQVR
jgi:hypothetical protein